MAMVIFVTTMADPRVDERGPARRGRRFSRLVVVGPMQKGETLGQTRDVLPSNWTRSPATRQTSFICYFLQDESSR